MKAYFLSRDNSDIPVFLAFPPCGPKLDFKVLPKWNWIPAKCETQWKVEVTESRADVEI